MFSASRNLAIFTRFSAARNVAVHSQGHLIIVCCWLWSVPRNHPFPNLFGLRTQVELTFALSMVANYVCLRRTKCDSVPCKSSACGLNQIQIKRSAWIQVPFAPRICFGKGWHQVINGPRKPCFLLQYEQHFTVLLQKWSCIMLCNVVPTFASIILKRNSCERKKRVGCKIILQALLQTSSLYNLCYKAVVHLITS